MPRVMTFSEALREAAGLDGVIGAALIDCESGMSYGERYGRAAAERVGGVKAAGTGGVDLCAAARASVPVMRACLRSVCCGADAWQPLDDLVFNLGGQYHVLRVVGGLSQTLYLYAIVDRREGVNLALTRLHLADVARRMANLG